jgi:hypothetical protein
MSTAQTPSPTADVSLMAPPAKLTFAERFRWLGIVANGVLVGAMLAYLFGFPIYHSLSPLEASISGGFLATAITFPVGWIVFVQWSKVRDAWAGLFVPAIVAGSLLWLWAVIDPTSALNFSWELPHGSGAFILLYVLMLGILWSCGIRLLDRESLAKPWQRGQFTIRTILALTVIIAAYTAVVRDIATYGPFSEMIYGRINHDPLFILITCHIAILGFALAMSGYVGWGVNVLVGGILYVVSLQLTTAWGSFYISEPKHWTHYVAMILFFTAAMTLPWVLIGWRVVWTPPLWDRSWRRAVTPE